MSVGSTELVKSGGTGSAGAGGGEKESSLGVLAVVLCLLVLFLFAAIKVAREYERAIVFRLGRLLAEPKGPGLFVLIPIVDRMVQVALRTITLNIPPHEG